MNTDYILLAGIAVIGMGAGLFLYLAASRHRTRDRQVSSSSYEEVQRRVDRRVAWAAVAAALVGVVGIAACFVAR